MIKRIHSVRILLSLFGLAATISATAATSFPVRPTDVAMRPIEGEFVGVRTPGFRQARG